MFNFQQIRSFLQYHLSGTALGGTFVFRRVKSVTFPKYANPIYSKYTLPDEEPDVIPHAFISREELDKSVRVTCSSFRGITDNRSMREEPDFLYNKAVTFSSETYYKFDVSGLTFDFIKTEPIVPIFGDLVCAFFSNSCLGSSQNFAMADVWFIASDQHLRALTAIMHDRHDSLSSLVAKNTPYDQYNEKLKEKLFCGNRLMTNTWLKGKLAHEQNGVTYPREVSIKNYWHLRTDNASKYWVDVWAALVLIGRYGELPSDENVPNTKGGEYQRNKWHLPEGFVEKLLGLCGIVIDDPNDEAGEEGYYSEEGCDEQPRTIEWPEDPEVVREWMEEQKNKEKNDIPKDIPILKEEVKVTTSKKRSILEITMSINWGEVEDDEKY